MSREAMISVVQIDGVCTSREVMIGVVWIGRVTIRDPGKIVVNSLTVHVLHAGSFTQGSLVTRVVTRDTGAYFSCGSMEHKARDCPTKGGRGK